MRPWKAAGVDPSEVTLADPEIVTVHGRQFRIVITGPDGSRRYNAVVTVLESGRLLTRSPVRGRSPGDVRDRALEVAHTLLGIERLQEEILAVAAQMAPGAAVKLTEDAHAIRADLSGVWEFTSPLAVERDLVSDPNLDVTALRDRVEAHFRTHLRRIAR